MQTANCTLALAGDTGNTIQKFDVTPSEVAVLRVIHGGDSVTDIEITGSVSRTNRAERTRLAEAYGSSEEGDFKSRAVEALFPGVAAQLYTEFEDLELPDDFYKAVARKAPKSAAKTEDTPPAAYKDQTVKQLLAQAIERGIAADSKTNKAALIEMLEDADADADDGDDQDDGIGAMDDILG